MKLEMRRGCIADWLGADGVLEIDMDNATREKVYDKLIEFLKSQMTDSINLCNSHWRRTVNMSVTESLVSAVETQLKIGLWIYNLYPIQVPIQVSILLNQERDFSYS